jgi:hypothetical protein
MVYVRVREKYCINVDRQNRKVGIFVRVNALLHTAIDKNVFCAYTDKSARARYLVRCTDKS